MNAEEWALVERLFDQGRQQPVHARDIWLQTAAAPPGLRQVVQRMLAADDESPEFLEPSRDAAGLLARAVAPLQGPSRVGETIGGWQIIEPIGAGGMGVVFLVQKPGLATRGALKLTHHGLASRAIEQRFVRERHILSRLEHPNIARLLDGGTSPDGQPYFVMEYVVGAPITRFCDAQQATVRRRLELFLQVCEAVAYSHRHLIVHRDVKPSNILVTDDGTAKLLDFGIAKLLTPDDVETAATLTQVPMFTPDYASPEQLEGAPVTTAADVWALGAVLHELLTGAKPFKGRTSTYTALITAILSDEPTLPSRATQVLPPAQLRGDLDNIVMQALRKQPERRYASVPELAEDIRRYLDGRPVTATADSLAYRVSKFVRRNRLATAVGVLVVLLAAVATQQGIVATRERARAQARFDQVRRLANSVIFTYQDGVKNLAGATAVRDQMVTDAAAYLDALSAEAAGEPELRMELARAYDRLGDVKAILTTRSVKDGEAANDFYAKALAIKQQLQTEHPTAAAYEAEVAVTLDKLGHSAFGFGDRARALERYGQARAIRERLIAGGSTDPRIRVLLMKNYRDLAVRGRTAENTDDSLVLCRRAVAMSEALLTERPDDETYLENHGDVVEGVAAILETSPTRRREAIAAYETLVAVRRQHAERFPANAALRFKLASAHSYLADTYTELQEWPAAVTHYRQSVAISAPMARQDPANEVLVQDAANFRSSLGYALALLGDFTESEPMLRDVIQLFEGKYARDQTDRTAHFRLAVSREGLALALTAAARQPRRSRPDRLTSLREARALYQQAVETYDYYRTHGGVYPPNNVDLDVAVTEVTDAIRRNSDELAALSDAP